MPVWAWVLLIIVVVLLLTGGIGSGRVLFGGWRGGGGPGGPRPRF